MQNDDIILHHSICEKFWEAQHKAVRAMETLASPGKVPLFGNVTTQTIEAGHCTPQMSGGYFLPADTKGLAFTLVFKDVQWEYGQSCVRGIIVSRCQTPSLSPNIKMLHI